MSCCSQMAHTPYRNVVDCARKMAQTEGIAAFYKSYPTTLVRTGTECMMLMELDVCS